MRFVSVAAMRRLDRQAIEAGTAETRLMARAGAGVARAVLPLLPSVAASPRRCVLVAGRGNNGGDACVAARLLHAWGVSCEVRLVGSPDALQGAAREAWLALDAAGVPWRAIEDEAVWRESEPSVELAPGTVLVDALLGTGSRGAPSGVTAAATDWVRRAGPTCRVLAVDLPSGLDADLGTAPDLVVQADATLTLGRPKLGFARPSCWPLLGRLDVLDIGLGDDDAETAAESETCACECLAAPELAGLLPRRSRDSHKGDYGHVLVIGGSRGFSGAPALAALGALRAGAGLVSAAVPAELAAGASSLVPEAMVHPLAAPGGILTAAALRRWRGSLERFDVVVAGPGLSCGEEARELVAWLLAGAARRLVLDADGLNTLAGWGVDPSRFPRLACEAVLTPHPGEAARLLGCTADEVQADRPAAARRLAETTGAVVVLKGCGTLVCKPGAKPQLNLTGNPGMATGGTGDVLAGVIGALCGRGLRAWDAARLGVWLHGTAGDLAAWKLGEEAVLARDVAAHLGEACARLRSGV